MVLVNFMSQGDTREGDSASAPHISLRFKTPSSLQMLWKGVFHEAPDLSAPYIFVYKKAIRRLEENVRFSKLNKIVLLSNFFLACF